MDRGMEGVNFLGFEMELVMFACTCTYVYVFVIAFLPIEFRAAVKKPRRASVDLLLGRVMTSQGKEATGEKKAICTQGIQF